MKWCAYRGSTSIASSRAGIIEQAKRVMLLPQCKKYICLFQFNILLSVRWQTQIKSQHMPVKACLCRYICCPQPYMCQFFDFDLLNLLIAHDCLLILVPASRSTLFHSTLCHLIRNES